MIRRILFTGILIAVSCGLSACRNDAQPSSPESSSVESLRPEVIVHTVKEGPIFKTYLVLGSVLANDTARITSKVSGRIKRVSVDEGDRVQQGDLLLLIDPADYEREYEHSTALMNQARVTLERAQRDLARMENLFTSNAVSEQTYQDAVTARDLAQYQYDQAASAQKMARQNLEECRLSAPIEGMITSKFVNEGELIGPHSPAFVIMQMDPVKVEVDLPEEIYSFIQVGNKSLLTVDALPQESFTGTITKVYPTVDTNSRTFKATITLNNPDLKLRSGMSARARVVQKARKNTLPVPKASIIPGEEGHYLYRLEGDSVERVQVRLGIEGDDVYEVVAGLREGDTVVIRGITGLVDGMKVRSREETVSAEE
ncbi:MAG: efflux RND transporter periplasmic adaptor subunit [Desulfomonilia bacterium]